MTGTNRHTFGTGLAHTRGGFASSVDGTADAGCDGRFAKPPVPLLGGGGVAGGPAPDGRVPTPGWGNPGCSSPGDVSSRAVSPGVVSAEDAAGPALSAEAAAR